jgi:hypothetical protein
VTRFRLLVVALLVGLAVWAPSIAVADVAASGKPTPAPALKTIPGSTTASSPSSGPSQLPVVQIAEAAGVLALLLGGSVAALVVIRRRRTAGGTGGSGT